MPVWRVVQRRWATLEEIERSWSIDDLSKANALLEYEADATAQATSETAK